MKVPLLLSLTLLLTTLAGCAEPPEVPEDAVVVTSPDLPGIVLSAWVEQRGDFVYLHALMENTGDEPVETKEDCGYLWQSTLRNETGAELSYHVVFDGRCDWFYADVLPGGHREFLNSWDHQIWVPGEGYDATTGDLAGHREEVPAGNFTWSIRFLVRDGADHESMEPRDGGSLVATVPFSTRS